MTLKFMGPYLNSLDVAVAYLTQEKNTTKTSKHTLLDLQDQNTDCTVRPFLNTTGKAHF